MLKPLLFLILLQSVVADWQYLSRPDLSPPKLNITVPAAESVAPGYIFVAPYLGFEEGSAGPEHPGAYILRNDGDLVWSGVGYFGGWVADFGPADIDGNTVLRAFQGRLDVEHGRMYGDHIILNDNYQTEEVFGTASHRMVSCHEFHIVGNGSSVLIETPVFVPADLTAYGGGVDEQNWIVNNGFQEIDLQTGELLFEWYSLDHVVPKYSKFRLEADGPYSGRSSFDAWNYFHINSVDKDSEGNYLISARNYAAIFKIDGTDGSIIWQLGGSHGSNFTIPEDVNFAYQHDARFRYRSEDGSIEHISFFDNARHSVPGHEISPFSRARFVELDHERGTARALHMYPAPDGLGAKSQGSVQLLQNSNVFVNWGQAGAVTEFAENGTILYHAYLDSEPYKNVQSYRGFRAEWTGYSNEEPAVLALMGQGGAVNIYVSWNGDTVTAIWRFYLHSPDGSFVQRLGEFRKRGFETRFETLLGKGYEGPLVVAEALDRRGHSLRQSSPVPLEDVAPYRLHVQGASSGLISGPDNTQQKLDL
ncbi:arylsulfotransferase family protein [Aspergillus stella-maris]|uniref:arylsulfotransferase family protein n=1 Tax=Aspergillus stella-maris TaxID=1810926 RepID=UPI003CCD14F0